VTFLKLFEKVLHQLLMNGYNIPHLTSVDISNRYRKD